MIKFCFSAASENNRHPQGGSEIMNSSHPVRRHRRVGSYGVEFSLPPDVTESSSPSQNLVSKIFGCTHSS